VLGFLSIEFKKEFFRTQNKIFIRERRAVELHHASHDFSGYVLLFSVRQAVKRFEKFLNRCGHILNAASKLKG
jgi:hypothetical protein